MDKSMQVEAAWRTIESKGDTLVKFITATAIQLESPRLMQLATDICHATQTAYADMEQHKADLDKFAADCPDDIKKRVFSRLSYLADNNQSYGPYSFLRAEFGIAEKCARVWWIQWAGEYKGKGE